MEEELLLWARRIIFLGVSFWVCTTANPFSLQEWPIQCNLKGRTDQSSSSHAVDVMLYGQAACLAMNNFVTKRGPLIPFAPIAV